MAATLQFERVISGDSHVREPVDMWWKAIGQRFGDRTPRVVPEHKGRKGKFFFTGQRVSKYGVAAKPLDEQSAEERLITLSGYDPDVRLDFQRRAGIAAEVMYPSLCAQIVSIEDGEVARAACQVYNDWIAEFCSRDRKRLVGAAAIPIQDIDWAVAEVKRTAAKGLRGAMINVAPPKTAKPYIDRAYDKLWAVCQDMQFPVILHIITGQEVDPLVYGLDQEDYAQAARNMFAVWNEIQETLSNDFIFGQILDRFPQLSVLCGEYELSWLPHFMFRMDQIQADFTDYINLPKLKHKASDYMRSRVFHGMVDDPYAQDGLNRIGYGQVLWGSDFPHVRSIGLDAQSRLADMLGSLPKDAQTQIVGGNAARLFNL